MNGLFGHFCFQPFVFRFVNSQVTANAFTVSACMVMVLFNFSFAGRMCYQTKRGLGQFFD
jgi:hypothetical protein